MDGKKRCLPLHAAGAGALHQAFDFLHRDAVEVAGDGVLEAGSRNGELQCLLLVFIMVQTVDQPAAEAVTAADTVDNVADLITLGLVELLGTCRPSCWEMIS